MTTMAAPQLVLLSIVCFIRLSSVDGRHCKRFFVFLVFGKCVQFCALFLCLVLLCFGLLWFALVCFALFCFVSFCFVLFCFVLHPFALLEGSWIDSDQLGYVEIFSL